MVLWTTVLILIENGTFKNFGRKPDTDVNIGDIDEDVKNE
jgi:hypothetical protein